MSTFREPFISGSRAHLSRDLAANVFFQEVPVRTLTSAGNFFPGKFPFFHSWISFNGLKYFKFILFPAQSDTSMQAPSGVINGN
jgi:hypothetical protein